MTTSETAEGRPPAQDDGPRATSPVVTIPDYGLAVFPQHAKLLAASAISPKAARARGYISADSKAQLGRYGFADYQRRAPGLLIPLHRADGSVWGYQLRADTPRVTKAGNVVKYETPKDQHNGIDVPPGIRESMGDPSVPLFVTEGSRKADSAASWGLACIALPGVWGWRGTNGNGGKLAVADWHEIALNGRRVVLAFDSDVTTKKQVRHALDELARYLAAKGAKVEYLHLPQGDDGKCGLDDYIAAEGAGGLWNLVRPEPPAAKESATSATSANAAPEPVAEPLPCWDGDLAGLLDDIHLFLGRFVAYPSEHAHTAHTLWVAHAHQMDAWESTPRIAFLSPEPGSGKTRALEVTELLVPRPVEAVNTTPAYLFRKVSSKEGLPTILYDEIDTLFGPRAKDNEEIRGMLNAGHRRGAVAGRCVTRGEVVETEELPAYCALALAGLGGLPDTLLTRSVVVRMKRRAPGERIEPFRRRVQEDAGHGLRDRLSSWAATDKLGSSWPDLPPGIQDRDADVWEALLAVAEAAGGDWPKRASEAAVALVADAKAATPSLGVRLLADLRTIWDGSEGMHTEVILGKLNGLDEAPWGDLKGKPLDARKLSRFLSGYDIGPHDIRADVAGTEKVRKGYKREDLHDAWQRYLPPGDPAAEEDADADQPVIEDIPVCSDCGEALDSEWHEVQCVEVTQ